MGVLIFRSACNLFAFEKYRAIFNVVGVRQTILSLLRNKNRKNFLVRIPREGNLYFIYL